MPLPPGVTTRTYTGTIVGLDGTNATGILEFRHPQPIYDADNNVVVGPQKPITAAVTAGTFTANLPISENPYVVRVATDALRDVYLLLVTAGSTPLTFASTYGTAASPELADFYVLQATFNALATRVADLEETGGVSVPDATSTTKGVLRLAGDLGGSADAPTVPALASKYVKPGGGIPTTDLSAAVQALLVIAGTAVQPGALAVVATSGAYADLTGRPSIPDSYDDLAGMVPTSALPALAINDTFPVDTQAEMLALTAQRGDVAIRADISATFILSTDSPATLADWKQLPIPAGAVISVNGQSGIVVLAKGDIGLGNVSNLAPADLPVSTATQTALDAKQAADTDLTAIAALAPADDAMIQRKSGAWTSRTPAQVKIDLGLAKADVGLGNADNTADVNKPVSTAQQAALDTKQNADADLTAIAALAPADDALLQRKASAWTSRTPSQVKTDLGLVKGDVGLGNVDNTSDLAKPISTATQSALDAKQASDADLTTIAGLSPSDNDLLQRISGVWAARTPAQVKTSLALVKGDVGLGNVDNTADTAKPVSTAQQTALDGKQNVDADLTAIAGLTPTNDDIIQRKAGAWAARSTAQLKADLAISYGDVSGTVPTSALPPLAINETTVVANEAAMLALTAQRGDMAIRSDNGRTYVLSSDSPGTLADWKEVLAAGQVQSVAGKSGVVTLVKADVGLGSVDNTSDASKPISSATQTALDGKQTLDSDLTAIAALTPANDDLVQRKAGAWTNRTIAQLLTDLAIDISKVSGLQAALDLKAVLASPTFTGTVTAPRVITPPVALSDAATIATDASLGNYFRVTLGGNRTLGNPTNPTDGQKAVWELIQDGTGSRTITLGSAFALGTDIAAVVLTTTASKRDFLGAVYNSTAAKWFVIALSKGY